MNIQLLSILLGCVLFISLSRTEGHADSDLLIGCFNIQIFGRTKAENDVVMELLCKILSRYDLVGVLEIRDSSQTAFPKLVDDLNRHVGGPVYEFVTGRRVGRSSSKEQTGFIYKSSKLEIVSMYERRDEYDVLEREPTVVKFRRTQDEGLQREFTFIPIHIKPDDALAEMNNLIDVSNEAERTYGPDIIVAGDFNADCSYMRESEWDNCKLRHDDEYQWLIDDNADTTTKKTDCAYDRIVLKGEQLQQNACCPAVYKFDDDLELNEELAEDVSDHYPVEFILA